MKFEYRKIELEELIDAIGGTEYCKTKYYYDAYDELGEALADLIDGCSTLYKIVEPLDLQEIFDWCKLHCQGEEI